MAPTCLGPKPTVWAPGVPSPALLSNGITVVSGLQATVSRVCIHRRPRRVLSAPGNGIRHFSALPPVSARVCPELSWAELAICHSFSQCLSTRARRHGGPGTDHPDRPPSALHRLPTPVQRRHSGASQSFDRGSTLQLARSPTPTLLTPPTHNFVRPIPLRGRGNPVQSPNCWEEHGMHEHAPADKAACQLIHTPLGRVPDTDTP